MTNHRCRNYFLLFASILAACVFAQFSRMPRALAGEIMVSTFTDEFSASGETDAGCSLREAIKLANGDAAGRGCALEPGEPIVIDGYTYAHVINMPPGDYALDHEAACHAPYENNARTGDLDVHSSVVIKGGWSPEPPTRGADPAADTIISSSCVLTGEGADPHPDRIFHLKPESGAINVRFENLKITGGKINDKGGGIFAEDFVNLALDRVGVRGNHASEGGGIYYAGNASPGGEGRVLRLLSVTVEENGAESKGSGIFIAANTNAAISGSSILNNSSYPCLWGGGIYAMPGSAITIEGSRIERNNSPRAQGGGIYMEGGGRSDLVLRAGTVVNENISRSGGGIYLAGGQAAQLSDCEIKGNEAKNGSDRIDGGGIANINGSMSIFNCSIIGNKAADDGGGLYTGRFTRVIVADSVFDGNEAGRGGAIANYAESYTDAGALNPGLSVDGSSISNNRAILRSRVRGGGEYDVSNPATTGRGGGIFNITEDLGIDPPENLSLHVVNSTIAKNNAAVYGGGLYNQTHNALLSHVTITKNESAMEGGGVYTTATGRLEIGDSILTGNTPDNCHGTVLSVGYNAFGLYDVRECRIAPFHDSYGVSPAFLQESGDPGKGGIYYMPLAGSVAVGGSVPERCPETDQRGIVRQTCVSAGSPPRCDSGSIQVCCGDGIAGGAEFCDSGEDNGSPNNCNAACSAMTPPVCGNRFIEAGEACDDGNLAEGDGCSGLCVIERGFACTNPCDDPDAKGIDCASRCATICGDGFKTNLEACDDGNTASGDGCNSGCLIETCGDGVVQAGLGEACDDGNAVGTDACTDFCQIARCGDGKVQSGVEECDDGNTETESCVYGESSCTVCDAGCRNKPGAISFCGDGTVNGAEVCDSGAENGQAGKCNAECSGEVSVAGPQPGGGGTEPGDGEARPEEGGGGCSLVVPGR